MNRCVFTVSSISWSSEDEVALGISRSTSSLLSHRGHLSLHQRREALSKKSPPASTACWRLPTPCTCRVCGKDSQWPRLWRLEAKECTLDDVDEACTRGWGPCSSVESTPSISHPRRVILPSPAAWTTMASPSFTDDHGTTIHTATTPPSTTLVAWIHATGWYVDAAGGSTTG